MPAFNLADLFVTLGLKSDDLKKGAKQAESALSGVAKQAVATAAGFIGAGSISQAVGSVKNAIVGAVKNFAELEKAMAEVSTLVDTSKVDMGALRDGVLKLSNAYGESPVGLTKALYQVVSAGVDAKDSIAFLEVATKAAIGGVTDTKTAVDALTSVVNAYGLKASDAGYASDILFQTIKAGKTTMAELAPAIGQVAPLASSAGVKLEEMSAALATLTLSGLSTSESATALRGLMNSLLKPTEDATKFSKQLGIQWGVEALQAKGLTGVLKDIIDKTGGSVKAMSLLVPEVRGMNAALQLTGPAAEKYTKVLGDMGDAAGATEEAAEKMKNSLDFEWNTFTQNVKNAATQLAAFASKVIRPAIGTLNELAIATSFWAKVTKSLFDAEESVESLIAKRNKTTEDYTRLIELARKELSGLTENGKKSIEEIERENKKRGEQAIRLENIIMLSESAISALADEMLAESEAADASIKATNKKDDAKQKAADKEAKRFEEQKNRNKESDSAEKDRLRLYETRAKLAADMARVIHELEMQEVNRRIEINEAIIADEKQAYARREQARADLERAKFEAIQREFDFQKKNNERMLMMELDRLVQNKEATQEDVDDTIELYTKAAKAIEAEFARKITMQTEAIIKVEADINKSMWEKLGDDVRKNFKSWADELAAGSSSAWSGLVSDSEDAITTIADIFGGLPDDIRGPLENVSNLIVAALSGNPITTAVAGLKLIGDAIFGAGKHSEEAARLERQAAQEALSAAKAFLKSQDKVDETLLSYDELNELIDETVSQMEEMATAAGIPVGMATGQVPMSLIGQLVQGLREGTVTAAQLPELIAGRGLSPEQKAQTIAGLTKLATGETGATYAELRGKVSRAGGMLIGSRTPEEALAQATTYRGADIAIQRMRNEGIITEDEALRMRGLAAERFKNQLTPIEYESIMAEAAAAESRAGGAPLLSTLASVARGYTPSVFGEAWEATVARMREAFGMPSVQEVEAALSGALGLDDLPDASDLIPSTFAGADTVGGINSRERFLDEQVKIANNQIALGDITAQEYKDKIFKVAKLYQGLAQEPGLSISKQLMLRRKAIDLIESSANVWQQGILPAVSSQTDQGVDVTPTGGRIPSPLGKQLGVTLLPGFAVTEGMEQIGFLDAVNTLAESISGAQPLLPDSMDINVTVTAGGAITDEQATQISVGIGEAISTSMTTKGVVV